MTIDVLGHDAAQILTTVAELGPAVIFHTLRLQMGFDPFAPPPDSQFEEWQEMPALTLGEAVHAITGSTYSQWQYSDAAALLRFLNGQPTTEWRIIDGYVVTTGE